MLTCNVIRYCSVGSLILYAGSSSVVHSASSSWPFAVFGAGNASDKGKEKPALKVSTCSERDALRVFWE